MTAPLLSSALMRNLVDERPEAVEQLLLLAQSYAPARFKDAETIAGHYRGKTRPTAELFDEMRGIYRRVVEAFAETARKNLVDGAFDEALKACDGFAYGLGNRKLRNEVSGQQGRWVVLSAKRRGGGVDADALRNDLLQDILATLDAIVDAAALPAVAPRSVEPVVVQDVAEVPPVESVPPVERSERSIIGAESDLVLTCEGLGRRYKGSKLPALAGVSLQILRGRILGVVGLNGSGKSTLLTILAGDLVQSEGTIERRGLARADIALVPQKTEPWAGQLANHLSLHAAYYGHTGSKNEKLVEETLTLLDLGLFRTHRYDELSAGIQTRCALARALVFTPKLLILDEPLASLDPVAQYRFLALLYAQARYAHRPLPVVLSSQHIGAVETFADEMLVLRDGRPIYRGPTALLGVERKDNVFEIQCPLSETALRAALNGLKPHIVPRANGQSASTRTLYELRVPLHVHPREILEALQARGVEPSHFADLSRSSLALLLEGDHA